jgi:hypothetical protein
MGDGNKLTTVALFEVTTIEEKKEVIGTSLVPLSFLL